MRPERRTEKVSPSLLSHNSITLREHVEKRETSVIFSLALEIADNVCYNDNNNKSRITWIMEFRRNCKIQLVQKVRLLQNTMRLLYNSALNSFIIEREESR